MNTNFKEILDFWFLESTPQQWFMKDSAFDQLIKDKFSDLHRKASACELWAWRTSAHGRLAEIIILDQFSRNIHRAKPESFSQDNLALALSQEAIHVGAEAALSAVEKSFLYMPFMHSESLLIQNEGVKYFEKNGQKEGLDFAIRHQEIIVQFGRFPHRNIVLGRTSTAAEIAFLKTPGSSF